MARLTQAKPRLVAPPTALTPPHRDTRDIVRYRSQPWRAWYGLKVWKDLQRMVYARDGMQCRQTGVLLIKPRSREEAKLPNAAIVDHIRPHEGDWDLFIDPDNLQLVAKSWHDAEKQRQERARPAGLE